jgi:hypothetical protein
MTRIYFSIILFILFIQACNSNRTDKNISKNIQETIRETDSISGMTKIKTYYENGKLKSDLSILNEYVNGISTHYYPNGKLKSIGNYVNGKAITYKELSQTGDYLSDYSLFIDTSIIGKISVNILTENGVLTRGQMNCLLVSIENLPAQEILPSIIAKDGHFVVSKSNVDVRKFYIVPSINSGDTIIIHFRCWLKSNANRMKDIGFIKLPVNN